MPLDKSRRSKTSCQFQQSLNRRLLDAEGPDDYTPEGMQRLVAPKAQREGVWRPAEVLGRTLDSIRSGAEYIERSRRSDNGWGYPDKHHGQLWATAHALMALCDWVRRQSRKKDHRC